MMIAPKILPILLAATIFTPAFAQQKLSALDRDRARDMLHTIVTDVRKHYYDPKLHGFDLDARVKQAEEKLMNAASLSEAFTIIAWTLSGLDDSHTVFIPPNRTLRADYGWLMQMIGDKCYVVRVRPGSDAASKGLVAGDQVLSINATLPTRDNMPVLQYYFNILSPRAGLSLLVKGLDGQERKLDLMARIKELPRNVDLTAANAGVNFYNLIREAENDANRTRTRCSEIGKELTICKMAEFNLGQEQVQSLLKTIGKHKSLILDLRGNPGGSVETLVELAGGFFDRSVKIGDRLGRKEMKPQVSRPQHIAFDGDMVVLVDSRSASAAEVFARLMQLEKRAAVVGDHSAGEVMEARFYHYTMGAETVVFYGAEITDADILMSDGKSLERVGVTPDELLLPTAADLAAGNDPVLAHAAQRLGYTLSPEEAGKLFPFQWAPN